MTPALRNPAMKPDRLDPALLKLAGIVVAGALASLLDTTILSVAINGLGREFGGSLATVQWVATAYLLAMAMAIPLTGWSVQRFGAKRMWMWTLAVFVVASVLCGLAWSIESLIVFRVAQGLAGGMILPLAQTILAQAAGPSRFGRVMALVAIPGQLAPIVGPFLGGALVDGAGWRWVFYVNVPVVGFALRLAWRGMHDVRPPTPPRLDAIGLVLLSPGVAALVYGLSQVGRGVGNVATISALAIGAMLVAAFSWHALRTRTAALLDVRLFRIRSYTLVAILTFLSGASIFGPLFLLPLYYQRVHGFSAVQTGLMLSPQGLGTAASLFIAGRLTDRIGTRPVVLAGLAATVAATIPFTQFGTDNLVQVIALLVRGMGLGAAGIAMMAGAYRGLRSIQIPSATGLTNIIQRVGGSFGTALVAVILQRASTGASTPAAMANAFGAAFWWTVGFALIALAPAWLLPSTNHNITDHEGTRKPHMFQIAVIIASTRQGRFGDTVAHWFIGQAQQRADLHLDVIDLCDVPLRPVQQTPFDCDDPAVHALAARIDAADGFVVITPEYNHGYPASLKLAIDSVYHPWQAKPVAFVSYGGVSGGLRAVEQLRLVFAELHTVTLRDTVSLSMAHTQFDEHGKPHDPDGVNSAAKTLLDQLTWWTRALRDARATRPYAS